MSTAGVSEQNLGDEPSMGWDYMIVISFVFYIALFCLVLTVSVLASWYDNRTSRSVRTVLVNRDEEDTSLTTAQTDARNALSGLYSIAKDFMASRRRETEDANAVSIQ